MNNKQLILIILAILVGCCIIGGCLYAGFDKSQTVDLNKNESTNKTNATVNNTTSSEIMEDGQNTNSNEEYTYSQQSDSYVKNSGEDYDTGVKDENGENIYAHRWVENGQVYETYQSASGRPIDTNEYYN